MENNDKLLKIKKRQLINSNIFNGLFILIILISFIYYFIPEINSISVKKWLLLDSINKYNTISKEWLSYASF